MVGSMRVDQAHTSIRSRSPARTYDVRAIEGTAAREQPDTGTVRVPARTVAVVIASWSGDVERVLQSLDGQTFADFEVVVVRGVNPAGRARNLGVAQTRGEFILFVDDDAYFGGDRDLERLVESMRADPSIGVTGTSKLLPPDASRFQQRVAEEVPRWVYPVMERDTESNPTLDHYGFTGITTTCCLVRRSVFEEVGGFNEELQAGEDTEFFFRIRRAGYRFVIPGHCWVYHGPPSHVRALVRKGFSYGMGHAQEALLAPERRMQVVPLDRWYGKLLVALSPALFVPSLFISLYFDPKRQWRLGFRPLKALSTYATLYGYTWRWLSHSH